MQNEDSNKNEQTTGGIGGADEQINISNNEEISQMELDAKYIINNFELNIQKGVVLLTKTIYNEHRHIFIKETC